MMIRATVLTLTLLCLSVLQTWCCRAESLASEYELSFEVDRSGHRESLIRALRVGADTIYCASEAGLYARSGREDEWHKLMNCQSIDSISNWWEVCDKKRQWRQLVEPAGLWYIAETDDIAVFDRFCGCLTKLRVQDNGESFFLLLKDGHGPDYLVRSMNVQGDLISCGTYSEKNTLVAVGNFDSKVYRRIMKCPEPLKRRADSLYNQTYPRVFPTLNPIDSTLWVAVWGYDYIYVIDLEGSLMDSIPITTPDYRLPEPIKSRLQTRAVWKDWVKSGWTPITALWYVPPGYFMLQYRNGWDQELDSIPLYSIAAWTVDREPIDLAVDKRWQIAGVQPDGKIILGRFTYEGVQRSIQLRVTRIKP